MTRQATLKEHIMKYEETSGEVKFWLGMIDWWEANQLGPVPDRMIQALSFAQLKDYPASPSEIQHH
jgi:hypothetical protein